jgi:ABC-2 type transport system permease protein
MARPAFLHVAANDIRLLLRERGTIFWSFIGPFIFATFFGLTFRERTGPPPQPEVAIENHDAGAHVVSAIAALLAEEDLKLVEASEGPEYVLVVPEGAADSLAAGRMPRWVLRTGSEEPGMKEQSVSAKVQRVVLRLALGFAPDDFRRSLTAEEVRAKVRIEPTVRLSVREQAVSAPVGGFQRSLPSYFVMMTFLNLFTYSSALLIEEKRRGHLQRVLVSPAGRTQIAAGKLVSRVAWAGLQLAVMILAGFFIFRIRFGAHPEALIALLGSFALCAAAMGVFYATLFESADKAAALGSIIVIVMSALGGCWWPLEIVPGWMRVIAFALPTGWAMNGIFRVMAFDASLAGIGTHLAVFTGAAVIFTVIAARRMIRGVSDR